jgi:hypothetical protein
MSRRPGWRAPRRTSPSTSRPSDCSPPTRPPPGSCLPTSGASSHPNSPRNGACTTLQGRATWPEGRTLVDVRGRNRRTSRRGEARGGVVPISPLVHAQERQLPPLRIGIRGFESIPRCPIVYTAPRGRVVRVVGAHGEGSMAVAQNCGNCGAVLGMGTSFCRDCGASVRSVNDGKCRTCGSEIQDDAQFCGGCGTNLISGETSIGTELPMMGWRRRTSSQFMDCASSDARSLIWEMSGRAS